jgi:hypothetical protein
MRPFKLIAGKRYMVRKDLQELETPHPFFDQEKNKESEMYITDCMWEIAGTMIKLDSIDTRGCGYHGETDCYWIPEFLINPIADKLDLI